ncbi:MAG: hypothetical protein J6S53_05405 [Lentisphaeria bacterium]|nr:hypothetical protein [Lentisphaeria bacterium]
MKFQVGYQSDRRFIQYIVQHSEKIQELYFPWGDFTTGRGVVQGYDEQKIMEEDLKIFSEKGVKLCLLLNGNCYGRNALGRSFFRKLGDSIDLIHSTYTLSSVTTASPVIAKFICSNFPFLEVRASVNMELGTVEAIEYLEEYFHSFYLKREYNYDRNVLSRMRQFSRNKGKKMYLLANSGCLNYCSARTFHDNLVAHQHQIAEMDNAFLFQGLCSLYLDDEEKRKKLLGKSNFIRPEDVSAYEELCDGMKLATRTNYNPLAVVTAYFNGKWHGNLLDLTEPAHSEKFPSAILDNRKIPADYLAKRLACDKKCENCSYCVSVLENAMVKLNDIISMDKGV